MGDRHFMAMSPDEARYLILQTVSPDLGTWLAILLRAISLEIIITKVLYVVNRDRIIVK